MTDTAVTYHSFTASRKRTCMKKILDIAHRYGGVCYGKFPIELLADDDEEVFTTTGHMDFWFKDRFKKDEFVNYLRTTVLIVNGIKLSLDHGRRDAVVFSEGIIINAIYLSELFTDCLIYDVNDECTRYHTIS